MTIERELVLRLPYALRDLVHGPQHILAALVRREALQALARGQFEIDAHAVGQPTQPGDQPFVRAGNGLGVDIAAEAVLLPQQRQRAYHQFHGVIRAADHA